MRPAHLTAAAEPTTAAPTQEAVSSELLDRVVEAIRNDCRNEPEEYVDEVVARGGGE
jgi:hypothetical protein